VPGLGNVWSLSLPTHADWFAAGMTLAVLRVMWEDGSLRLPRHWQVVSVASTVPILVVTLKLHYDGTLDGLDYQSPIAWACALVLAPLVLAPHTTRAARVLTLRPIAAIGAASYSLFLWHDPLVRYLRDNGLTAGGAAGFAANLLVVAALAGIASALTYRFVEQPALRRKRGWQRAGERAPQSPPETAPASAAA
jgi:peptidoglycan/LPS O-acetylase OafA/YrhL